MWHRIVRLLAPSLERLVLVSFLLLWAFRSTDAADATPAENFPSANPNPVARRKPDTAIAKILTAIRSDSMPMTAVLYGIPEPHPDEFVLPEDPIKGMLQDTRTKVDETRP